VLYSLLPLVCAELLLSSLAYRHEDVADVIKAWPCCRLDYPGIGPEHSYLKDLGRAEYYAVTDAEALEAFVSVSRLEGIIPALETSHAFAYLDKYAPSDHMVSLYADWGCSFLVTLCSIAEHPLIGTRRSHSVGAGSIWIVVFLCYFTGEFLCACRLCPTLPNGTRVVVNLSGRGDKDVNTAAKYLDISGGKQA